MFSQVKLLLSEWNVDYSGVMTGSSVSDSMASAWLGYRVVVPLMIWLEVRLSLYL